MKISKLYRYILLATTALISGCVSDSIVDDPSLSINISKEKIDIAVGSWDESIKVYTKDTATITAISSDSNIVITNLGDTTEGSETFGVKYAGSDNGVFSFHVRATNDELTIGRDISVYVQTSLFADSSTVYPAINNGSASSSLIDIRGREEVTPVAIKGGYFFIDSLVGNSADTTDTTKVVYHKFNIYGDILSDTNIVGLVFGTDTVLKTDSDWADSIPANDLIKEVDAIVLSSVTDSLIDSTIVDIAPAYSRFVTTNFNLEIKLTIDTTIDSTVTPSDTTYDTTYDTTKIDTNVVFVGYTDNYKITGLLASANGTLFTPLLTGVADNINAVDLKAIADTSSNATIVVDTGSVFAVKLGGDRGYGLVKVYGGSKDSLGFSNLRFEYKYAK